MARDQWSRIEIRNVARLEKVAVESFIDVTQRAVTMSPIRDGIFANNWFTEINGITSKTTDETDSTGSARLAEAEAEALRIKVGDSVSFANALPYAIPIERGHSEQAKNGIVKVVSSEWQYIVNDAVRGIE